MARAILDFDQVAIMDIRVGTTHSFFWEMELFEDDAETIPLDWTGTHKIVISRDQDGDSIVYTITEANIMTITGNNMTIDFTTALTVIPPGEYFLDWRSDDVTDHSVPIAQGKAYFTHKQAKP